MEIQVFVLEFQGCVEFWLDCILYGLQISKADYGVSKDSLNVHKDIMCGPCESVTNYVK